MAASILKVKIRVFLMFLGIVLLSGFCMCATFAQLDVGTEGDASLNKGDFSRLRRHVTEDHERENIDLGGELLEIGKQISPPHIKIQPVKVKKRANRITIKSANPSSVDKAAKKEHTDTTSKKTHHRPEEIMHIALQQQHKKSMAELQEKELLVRELTTKLQTLAKTQEQNKIKLREDMKKLVQSLGQHLHLKIEQSFANKTALEHRLTVNVVGKVQLTKAKDMNNNSQKHFHGQNLNVSQHTHHQNIHHTGHHTHNNVTENAETHSLNYTTGIDDLSIHDLDGVIESLGKSPEIGVPDHKTTTKIPKAKEFRSLPTVQTPPISSEGRPTLNKKNISQENPRKKIQIIPKPKETKLLQGEALTVPKENPRKNPETGPHPREVKAIKEVISPSPKQTVIHENPKKRLGTMPISNKRIVLQNDVISKEANVKDMSRIKTKTKSKPEEKTILQEKNILPTRNETIDDLSKKTSHILTTRRGSDAPKLQERPMEKISNISPTLAAMPIVITPSEKRKVIPTISTKESGKRSENVQLPFVPPTMSVKKPVHHKISKKIPRNRDVKVTSETSMKKPTMVTKTPKEIETSILKEHLKKKIDSLKVRDKIDGSVLNKNLKHKIDPLKLPEEVESSVVKQNLKKKVDDLKVPKKANTADIIKQIENSKTKHKHSPHKNKKVTHRGNNHGEEEKSATKTAPQTNNSNEKLRKLEKDVFGEAVTSTSNAEDEESLELLKQVKEEAKAAEKKVQMLNRTHPTALKNLNEKLEKITLDLQIQTAHSEINSKSNDEARRKMRIETNKSLRNMLQELKDLVAEIDESYI